MSSARTSTLTPPELSRAQRYPPARNTKVRAWLSHSASSSSLKLRECAKHARSLTHDAQTPADSRARSKSEARCGPLAETLFTPSATPFVVPTQSPSFAPKKSASSPQLHRYTPDGSPSFEPVYPSWELTAMGDNSDNDRDGGMVFAIKGERTHVGTSAVRTRRGGSAFTEGVTETETEMDSEGPVGLPTARHVPCSTPSTPLHPLQWVTPYLFEFSRLLSIVPAIFGTLYNIHNIQHPPPSHTMNSTLDYFVSALWAILTGFQCLSLTTGLLSRWQAYYPPLSTLIRLLALQAICWPATHLTLTFFNHAKRPIACWALIGSTTCVSRSVQLWVTSNLWEARGAKGARMGSKLGERRWDWTEVGVKCVLPAGVLYFVTTWALILKMELGGC